MITINVSSDIDRLAANLRRDVFPQLPFATAKALTDTAKDVQRTVTREIDAVFDRPIPFTRKAIGITYANKRTLTSKVFIKDIQAAYLDLEIIGGTRTPKGRALVLPVDQPTNQYGNLPRGKVKALLARADTFSGRVRGIPGIWQRTRKGLKLLIAYRPRASYRKRFPFYEIAARQVQLSLPRNFQAALAQAVRSAR